jgi:hypothetical protein
MMELDPGGQEIFLVRDFRDMYCSMLQFSKHRQTDDFGWQAEHADDYMEIVAERVEQLRVSYENRVKKPHLLRYEDLLTRPPEVLRQLLADLDLTHNPNTISDMVNAMNNTVEGHQTSKNAPASIGRWKNELNRKQKSRINMIFRKSLSTFGYEVKD